MITDERIDEQVQPTDGEVTVDELEENLGAEAEEEMAQEGQDAGEAIAEAVRQGIGELFEDGWTAEELLAFSHDEGARRDVANGHSVSRAACAYLRRAMQAQGTGMRKRAVPTVRQSAVDAGGAQSRIDQMTDAQFDAFSRKARAAMMAGRRVRL